MTSKSATKLCPAGVAVAGLPAQQYHAIVFILNLVLHYLFLQLLLATSAAAPSGANTILRCCCLAVEMSATPWQQQQPSAAEVPPQPLPPAPADAAAVGATRAAQDSIGQRHSPRLRFILMISLTPFWPETCCCWLWLQAWTLTGQMISTSYGASGSMQF